MGTAYDYFYDRTEKIFAKEKNSDLNSSEGSRINSIDMAFDSLKSNNGFIGQGFGSNLSNWIYVSYPNTRYSMGEKGEVYNTYVAIIAGVGIPGFLAFIGIIYESFKNSKNDDYYQKVFFLTWLLVGFTTGSLVYYTYWGIFYLAGSERNTMNNQKTS